ncbi:MAG TPA: NAD(+) synthase, partial [Candidatus Sabulitectum sp.]|nr:NAD(+) synthase [Candidatus Sabulitectum sp.]
MTEKSVYGDLRREIVRWIASRVENAGMNGVVIGLSGGIDSGVTAALCAEAVGKENVLGLIMPCGSIAEDTEDGHRIADFLGIEAREIDLTRVLEAFAAAGELDTGDRLNLANVKARLRMAMEYACSSGRLARQAAMRRSSL